jgi:hypothetical protein
MKRKQLLANTGEDLIEEVMVGLRKVTSLEVLL